MSTTVILQSAPIPLQYRNADGDEPQPILANELNTDGGSRDGEREAENVKGRWLCVLGAFAFAMPSFGFMQSVGTIQSFLHLNQLGGYTTSDVGWITGTYMFLSYFLTIQVGPICDMPQGPRVLAPAGIVATVLSFVLLAECSRYWHFMLCFGVLGSLGGAMIATLGLSVLAKLFPGRGRGLAMGLALVGSAVGSIVFPLLLRWALPRLGWQWAMRLTALVVACDLVLGFICFLPSSKAVSSLLAQDGGEPAADGQRQHPGHNARRPRLRATINLDALRSLPFALVAAGSFLLEFAIFSISGMLPTIATSAGLEPEVGYTLLAVVGACACPGRALPGLMAEWIGPFNSLLIMNTLALLVMATVLVPFATESVTILYVFAALWGFASGAFLSVTPACLGRTCSTKNYGRYLGTMTFLVSFSVLLAIPLSGWLLDSLGTRALSGLLTAVVFAGGLCYVAARAVLNKADRYRVEQA